MQFIHSEQIKTWISQNLTTNYTRGFFVDVLFSVKKTKKVSVISGLDYSGQTEIISEIYSRFQALDHLNDLYLVDLSSVYVHEETKIDDFLDKIQTINNAFVIINNMNQQEGTRIWFKQIAKLAKKQNITFYLFVNNSGILYHKIIEHYNFNHFYLKPFKFSEYLITKEKFSNLDFVDYYEYLNSYSPILARFSDKSDAQILFFNQIVNLFRHDVYELFSKKFSIKTCMALLNIVVYAKIPCFNLNYLSKEIEIDFEELLEIIRILDKAKILKMIRVIESDLSKKREPLYFLVFYHPINYVIFEHNEHSISEMMNNTKVLLSAFISATNFQDQIEIVYDYHVSWTEQIALIDKHKKRGYILGINNHEVGPIFNALSWKYQYRVNYLNQNDLVNLIANWELKKLQEVSNFIKYKQLWLELKKNKSETITTKKRGRKARIEQELEQPIQDYRPKLLNVKVQSELDQEDDLDFSHKSIVNDENEIFSGEIKTNRSQLKNKYFDTVLDEEDLLQREFDEIKEKSKKRLISKKAKATDQTAQAIKQSINKRFDDFFDETEKSLITNTIYDGDYHENELADQDLIEKAHDFENASVLIDEIINSSLSQEEKKQEEVYDSLAEITNLNEAELTELENLDLNKLDFDPNQEQKPTTDQHVYQAIAIDEAALKHEIYEPDVLLNIEQPIEINQELSIPIEIKQDLDLDRIKVEEVTDNALINAITSPIQVEVAEITDLVIEVETQIPKISPETIQEEIIDIKVHDLTKDQVIKNKLKPSYQATSEVVDYAVDEKPTDNEIIKVNDTTDKLSVQSNLNDENIRYEVQQEENTKPKEVHVDVDQLNIKLNKELKKLAKPKKPLDQLEEIPAVIKQDKYVKQEVENIPTNDYRIKKPLDQLQEIPAIIKQVNFVKQEVKKLSTKKPLDQLEEIPAVIKQDKYVKQEVENIPTNDYRNFDSFKTPLDQLKEIPVVLNNVDLATPKAKLSQLAELVSSTTDKVEKEQVNSVVDLTEVQKLVDQLEELVKQNQQLLEEKEPQTTENNDQVDLLENLINEFDYELEQLEELNKNFNTKELDQNSKTTDIIVEDLATTEVEFKPNYQALTSELLDDTMHPIKHYDSGWKPQEIDVKYNYSEFDFNDYHKILDQQTEFKMFCKKAIDYSRAPMIKMSDEQSPNQDDLIELDHDETTNSTDQIQLTDNVADIEVSDWETIENHPMIDFQSLINKHSEQSKYYLEDKSSTTELVEQLDETDQTQETDFNFEGLDEDITSLIIKQKENIKHRLISQGEYNPENLTKELNQRLKEETRKIVVKNINNEYTNIKEINKFKKPLVSVEIKPVHPFATKSLKNRLIASQKIEAKTVSKKVAAKSILNDLKGYQFKGANLIFQKSEPKKLTNNK